MNQEKKINMKTRFLLIITLKNKQMINGCSEEKLSVF